MAAFAARPTDLCSKAYPEFPTDLLLSLAIDHFIGAIADVSNRDHIQRERARRPLEWTEVVSLAHSGETNRIANTMLNAAAIPSARPSCARDSESVAQPDRAASKSHDSRSTKGKGARLQTVCRAAAGSSDYEDASNA